MVEHGRMQGVAAAYVRGGSINLGHPYGMYAATRRGNSNS